MLDRRKLQAQKRLAVRQHIFGMVRQARVRHEGRVGQHLRSRVVQYHGDAVSGALRLARRSVVVERQFAAEIAPERKQEIVGRLEGGVLAGGIERDTDDLYANGVKLALEVAEPATLDRSTCCGCRGVEPQHRPVALQGIRRHLGAR